MKQAVRYILCIAFTTVMAIVQAAAQTSGGNTAAAQDTAVTVLDASVVVSDTRSEQTKIPQMAHIAFNSEAIAQTPSFLGENDIVKVLQMMPGVQAPSDGSSGFSARGGLIDQNLVLLDGAPIYTPGHLLGFISMFNSDAVGSIDLYKGDFPSRYGGRIASVLEAATKVGRFDETGGNFTIGPISTRLFAEGPLVRDCLSFSFGARRSFADLVFPFVKLVPERSKLHFQDINAKLTWRASERDLVSLSGFYGGDVFGTSLLQHGLTLMDFGYTNSTLSLQWKRQISPSLKLLSTLYYSKYRFLLDCDYNFAIFEYSSFVREAGLKSGILWHPDNCHTVEIGLQLPFLRVRSGDCVPKEGNITFREMHIPSAYAVQPNIYAEHTVRLSCVKFRYGLRISEYTSLGPTDQHYYDPVTHRETGVRYIPGGKPIQTYWGLEPRMSASFLLSGQWSLKASYMRSYQYIQQALVSTSGSPLDIWLPASPAIKPQISDQFSLGVNGLALSDAVEASAEMFYKNNKNTLDFVENSGFVIDRPDRESLLRFGRSYVYGAELTAKYEIGRCRGWLGYTLSLAVYDIPEINGGRPYASPVNHDHAVNLLTTYDFSPRVSASAYWVYYSGAPTTLPVGRFAVGGSYAPIFTSRNEDRFPDYHRLDLSLTLRTKSRVEKERWSGEWNFSLFNTYSRHNVWSLTYSYSQFEDKPKAVKLYLFPILPSVSYNILF